MNITRAVQKVGRVTINPFVLWLVHSGRSLAGAGPDTVLSLSAVGRKSGRPRVTPMGYVRAGDDTVWVVSEHGTRSDWYRNARHAGTVEVRVGGRTRRATVRPRPEEDPRRVLKRMNRLVALANRALWDRPAVIEIRLLDG